MGFNLFYLFVPSRCASNAPPHTCVPPALAAGDKFDLWVYASPKPHFHQIEAHVTSGAGGQDPEVRPRCKKRNMCKKEMCKMCKMSSELEL